MSQDAKTLTFAVNETDLLRMMESREAFLGGSIDAKRPTAWCQYGYPTQVTFGQLFSSYSRGGAGHGAVHRLLDGCWQGLPRVKKEGSEEESEWEKSVAKALKPVRAWAKLRDFDRRNMVGRYAALIYRVGDGKALREPMIKASRLVDIVPLYEDQIEPTAWNDDETSEDFGKPTMYQYTTRAVQGNGNTKGRPEARIDVHPSRVQILAEGSVGDMFDGVPLLLAGFNHLVDLEKIAGGSAESYLKNSSRTLHFNFDKDASMQVLTKNADGTQGTKDVREVIEERARALNRNIDSSVVTQGGDVATLQTQISDPEPSFQVAANLFSASVQIPFTVLFGQQTGRLASDEDQADMVKRCKSRQENELTPMIEEFVRRMQAAGLLEDGEFEVEWPDIAAPTDQQKVDRLVKLTQAAKTAFDAGLTEPLFDANELRKTVDFEERDDDGMPTEADIAAEEAAAAAALAAAQGAKPAPTKKPAPAAA